MLAGLALVYLVLLANGVALWRCPLFASTGVPCPGCGLSRATLELVTGHPREALQQHVFAPLVVLGAALLLAGAVLPPRARNALADALERVDRYARVTALLLGLLVVYWIARFFTG